MIIYKILCINNCINKFNVAKLEKYLNCRKFDLKNKLYKVFDSPQDRVKSLNEPLMEKKLAHWKKQYFKSSGTKF